MNRKSRLRSLSLLICVTAGLSVAAVWGAVWNGSDMAGGSGNYAWTGVAPQNQWSPGYAFTVLEFDNKLWAFGRSDGNWFSSDGKAWIKSYSLGDIPRGHNAYIVYNNRIYAIGGTEDRLRLGPKAVWSSNDGVSWKLVTDHPEWSARIWHQCAVFNGRLWLIGGYDGADRNDVWYSRDGVQWSQATVTAPWAGRCMHTSVVFKDRLWVLGGRRNMDGWWETDFNDVWYSADGVVWQRAVSSATWSKRFGHASVAWDGKLWVLGGSRLFPNNEVWFSEDGYRWTRLKNAEWTPRFSLASAVFQDKLWILGGKEGGGKFTNDVWYLQRRIAKTASFGPTIGGQKTDQLALLDARTMLKNTSARRRVRLLVQSGSERRAVTLTLRALV